MKPAVYIFNIHISNTVNGVNSHIDTFLRSIIDNDTFVVYYICFLVNKVNFFIREKIISKQGHTIIYIPFPYYGSQVLNDSKLLTEFSAMLFPFIKPYFKKHHKRILHVHTINLFHIALFIKKHYTCKIVSHIHCTPWMYKIDYDYPQFLTLMNKNKEDKLRPIDVITSIGELQSYTLSDYIITVSKEKKDFLQDYYKNSKITYIPNGLIDTYANSFIRGKINKTDKIKCIYVGNASKGKGLHELLKGINLASNKHMIDLYIVGQFEYHDLKMFYDLYPNIHMFFMGILERETLLSLYQQCSVGFVYSFHEQCSYTAIEMMMSELAIIYTLSFGLKEMFSDGNNVVGIPCFFNKDFYTDHQAFASALDLFITDPKLRKQFGQEARKNFLNQYNSNKMVKGIIDVYNEIWKDEKR